MVLMRMLTNEFGRLVALNFALHSALDLIHQILVALHKRRAEVRVHAYAFLDQRFKVLGELQGVRVADDDELRFRSGHRHVESLKHFWR